MVDWFVDVKRNVSLSVVSSKNLHTFSIESPETGVHKARKRRKVQKTPTRTPPGTMVTSWDPQERQRSRKNKD